MVSETKKDILPKTKRSLSWLLLQIFACLCVGKKTIGICFTMIIFEVLVLCPSNSSSRVILDDQH